jgi:D-alanyl-D-alanine carboxypeptidase
MASFRRMVLVFESNRRNIGITFPPLIIKRLHGSFSSKAVDSIFDGAGRSSCRPGAEFRLFLLGAGRHHFLEKFKVPSPVRGIINPCHRLLRLLKECPILKTTAYGRRTALILFAAAFVAIAGCQSAAAPSSDPASGGKTENKAEAPSSGRVQAVSLNIEPGTLSLAPGAKTTIAVKAVQKDQQSVPLSHEQGAVFTSSAPDIVAVSDTGVATASTQAKSGQKAVITVKYMGLTKELPVTVKTSLDDTIAVIGGVPTVTNPDSIDVVVDKKRRLPSTYIPKLVEPNVPFIFKEKSEKRMMRPEAAQALESLFAAAKKDGVTLYGVSAYRSYATQKSIFGGNVKSQGKDEANQFSAKPGESEHQTGLAIDVGDGNPKCTVEQCFADSPASKWLEAHAAEYGFIIRYLKGKEAITGYQYEPWHIRYVGKDIAADIAKSGLTLEEYFQDAVAVGAKAASDSGGSGTSGGKSASGKGSAK